MFKSNRQSSKKSTKSVRTSSAIVEDLESRRLMSVTLPGAVSMPLINSVPPLSVGAPMAVSTGLSAVALTSTSVKLTWLTTDASATGTRILRSTDGTNYTILTTLSGKPLTYTDTTVSSFKSYSYKVQTFNATASAEPSTAATVSTPLAAPAGLVATAVSNSSAKLTWTNSESQATGFYILRAIGTAVPTRIATITSASTLTYTDTTASSGTAYIYTVQAYNGSATSLGSKAATVNIPVAAPSGLQATITGATSVQLQWTNNDTNATSYVIYRVMGSATTLTQIGTSTTTSFTDTAAGTGRRNYYVVRALVKTVASEGSAPASVVLPMVASTGLSAIALTPTSVKLTWLKNDSSATGIKILRSLDGTTYTTLATLTSGTALTYTDTTVSSSTTYRYRVQAFNLAMTADPSAVATVATPLGIPTSVVATAQGPNTVLITWTKGDTTATGYYVVRMKTGGTLWTRVATISSGDTCTYTDTAVDSGTAYTYAVQTLSGDAISSPSANATVTTKLAAASGLTASLTSGGLVQLSWTGNDSTATGYVVLRALSGSTTYTTVATLASAGYTTYVDTTAASGKTYVYRIQAYKGSVKAEPCEGASVTTPLKAPTNLSVAMSGLSVKLTWTSRDAGASGYNILKSTDGTTFTKLASVSGATTTTYTDSAVSGGQTYYYKVQAATTATTSDSSNVASITPTGTTVSAATRYGNELVITATGGADNVLLKQDGTTLTLIANGSTFTYTAPAAGVFIYARGGTDTITIDTSVNVRTTVEGIDGVKTTVTSNAKNVSAWLDSTDTFTGTGSLHSVASFVANVSKAVGVAMANPTDSGKTIKATTSLWGTAPVMGDVNQGMVGDCYFLAGLAAFAGQRPQTLMESAVDMGDGTYVVQYMKSGAASYIRVSNDLPSNYAGTGFLYARPGSNGTVWTAILEKAFCYFRKGTNTYASIASGWMSEAYAVLGSSATNAYPSSTTDDALYQQLSTALANGQAVTAGTNSSVPNLVGGHAYTIVSVQTDSNGVHTYTVRNPWGVKGGSSEDSSGYATLTFAQMQANFAAVCLTV